ncbi:MAG: PQQ-binding-like beta-propeller repeat protein [Pseudomonadales bacterium]
MSKGIPHLPGPVLLRSVLAMLLSAGGQAAAAADPSMASAEPVSDVGAALYQTHCAQCHDEAFYKAPSRVLLRGLTPDSVLRAMTDGRMRAQASAIDPSGRMAIAEYVTGRRLSDVTEPSLPPACAAEDAFDPSLVPVSRGWGVDVRNTRFQPVETGGLSAANVADLEVKWAFAYPNAIQARSQPVYGGGTIYVGSQDGTVWALGAETGCLRWRFRAAAEVRTGITITPWTADQAEVEPLVFFGDLLANVYAVEAKTGELRWRIAADEHRDATLTGTPAYFRGRLYIPVSSLEVVAAADPGYACCTFRGSVLAVDAGTGTTVWKAYTIDDPAEPVAKTSVGTTTMAPSGAPIWSAPTIDERRQRLYVGTGENYSSPADGNSDAIMAFDLATGRKLWVAQQTSRDAWNVACFPAIGGPNCPEENGPDYDFGSHPILIDLEDGTDMLVAGQKSGGVVGLNPETGETVWKTRIGRGGVQGGVHFGIAAEGETVYVPINDLAFGGDEVRYDSGRSPAPGVHALNARTGERLWSAAADDVCADLPRCSSGVSQAIAAIPGAVVAGFLDGRLRIYTRDTGELLWQRNMLGPYPTVSGATAIGGAFSGGGVLIARGLIYVNAGYGFNNHMPGNALVVLGPKESD